MRYLILLSIIFSFSALSAQKAAPLKLRGPIWYAPADHTKTCGIALGPVLFWGENMTSTINGIGIELGIGLLLPVGVGTPLSSIEPEEAAWRDTIQATQRLNGINLSATGTVGPDQLNGLSINGIGTAVGYLRGLQASIMLSMAWEVKGASLAVFHNDAYRVHGAQIALLSNNSAEHKGFQMGIVNRAHKMRGIQIGGFNKSRELRGLQLGLWNKSQQRSLPLINWG